MQVGEKRTKTKKARFLGTIRSSIVGRQFRDPDVSLEAGAALGFEREPENKHDANAIRVENDQSQQVGYLPREHAAWLSHLIDSGKIRLEGNASVQAEVPEDLSEPSPLLISINATKKGRSIFEKRTPENQADAFHQLMLHAYRKSAKSDDDNCAQWFYQSLVPAMRQELLPETRLVFALLETMHESSATIDLEAAHASFAELLANIRVGKPRELEEWSFYPLRWKTPQTADHIILSEAIETKAVIVEELDHSGTVDTVRLINRGSRPVLVPEGDILIGAKQNRVINITVLVEANSTIELPVSCVEQGRWKHVSADFSSQYIAPASLRAAKMRSIDADTTDSPDCRASDQGEVWDNVERCLCAAAVSSETASLTAGLDAVEKRAKIMRKQVKLPKKSSGVLVMRNGQFRQVELFASPEVFGTTWEKLTAAILLDESVIPENDLPSNEPPESIIDQITQAATPSPSTPGLGIEMKIQSKSLTGMSVMHYDNIFHLTAIHL